MSSHVAASDHRPQAQASVPTEHSSLLHWGRAAEEGHPAPQAVAPAQTKHRLLDHVAHFTQPAGTAHPAAEAHAKHFWHIERPKAHVERPYTPGIADAIRLNGITFGAESVMLTYAAAGFIDAMFPRGSTVVNPEGTRHELAAVACLLGAYIAYRSVVPAVAGNLYGALLFGCTKVNDRLHAHPISTRLAGYLGAGMLSAGAIGGAVALHVHNRHNTEVRVPEQGYEPSIYSSASVLALAVSVPEVAALGWYLGRITSAVCHKRP